MLFGSKYCGEYVKYLKKESCGLLRKLKVFNLNFVLRDLKDIFKPTAETPADNA